MTVRRKLGKVVVGDLLMVAGHRIMEAGYQVILLGIKVRGI